MAESRSERRSMLAPVALAATAGSAAAAAFASLRPLQSGTAGSPQLRASAAGQFLEANKLPSSSLSSTSVPAIAGSLSCVGAVAALTGAAAVATKRSVKRQAQGQKLRASATALQAAGNSIETFLVEGPVDESKLSIACAELAMYMDLTGVAFFTLGVDPKIISAVAGGALGLHGVCPIYVADCYGIIGWDKKQGKNVELMEKGRGTEYGMAGGQGGEGVVVVAFRGDGFAPNADANLPDGSALHMVVAGHESKALSGGTSGVAYGGAAKTCYKLEHSGDLVEVPRFAISANQASSPTVVSSFQDGDAGDAAEAALKALSGKPTAAAYFPCFCRGFNKYGENGVEPDAFAKKGLDGVKLFGMFAHGELGPPLDKPVLCTADSPAAATAESHSSTSILALYGA
eukprot:TRINITY_DN21857_c0_g1_i2.p1 TRINITY_DN21857_c0_g1~~TRINITY_DN21857_c0_g1_i2.p1  ORF type:complete len:418 (+),score=83.55 TRINITY_DN21857_c0_g1_i2:51-1256(+)